MADLGGRRLRVWQRVHVRITALYALPLFAILAVVGVLAYRRAVDEEHAILRARLRALSVAAAAALDPTDVATGGPAHDRLERTLAAISPMSSPCTCWCPRTIAARCGSPATGTGAG